MSNEKLTSPMFQATSMMLEAMRDLKDKKISPQTHKFKLLLKT